MQCFSISTKKICTWKIWHHIMPNNSDKPIVKTLAASFVLFFFLNSILSWKSSQMILCNCVCVSICFGDLFYFLNLRNLNQNLIHNFLYGSWLLLLKYISFSNWYLTKVFAFDMDFVLCFLSVPVYHMWDTFSITMEERRLSQFIMC